MNARKTPIWAVLPVRRFRDAKQRLSAILSAIERAELARLMFEDVIESVSRAPFAGIVIVSDEPGIVAPARRFDATLIPDPKGSNINATIQSAIRYLAVKNKEAGIIAVPADLPHATQRSLADAIDHLQDAPSIVLVRATRDGGTNLFGCNPAKAIQPQFGADSFARHESAARKAGIRPIILHQEDLAIDIDRPDDLDALMRNELPCRARAFLVTIGIERRLRDATAPAFSRSGQ